MVRLRSTSIEKLETVKEIRLLIERRKPALADGSGVRIDVWLRDIAPSPGLDAWFERSAEQWNSFRDRYSRELLSKPDRLAELFRLLRSGPVCLVCVDGDKPFSVAAALKGWIETNWNHFDPEGI